MLVWHDKHDELGSVEFISQLGDSVVYGHAMDEDYRGIFDYETIKNGSSFIPEEYADIFDKIENQSTIHSGRIFTLLIMIASVFGCIGNVLICYVIIFNKNMHTTINMYLFNLAVSDCIQLVAFSIGSIYSINFSRPYSFPVLRIIFECVRWLYSVACLASVLITLAVTVDRYIAICYPLIELKISSKARTLKIIVIIWICSLFYMSIQEIVPILCKNFISLLCYSVEYLRSTLTFSLIFFFIPMILNTIMYTLIGLKIWSSLHLHWSSINRNHNNTSKLIFRKHFKMSVAVVVEMLVCWGPLHVVILLYKYGKLDNVATVKQSLMILSLVLYISSTVIDPIIYSIMSMKFRKAFKNLLCTSCNQHQIREM